MFVERSFYAFILCLFLIAAAAANYKGAFLVSSLLFYISYM